MIVKSVFVSFTEQLPTKEKEKEKETEKEKEKEKEKEREKEKEKEKERGKEKVIYTAKGNQDGKIKAADKLTPPPPQPPDQRQQTSHTLIFTTQTSTYFQPDHTIMLGQGGRGWGIGRWWWGR
jgi:hypothetical protein